MLFAHPELVQGQRILELGSGVGLTGLCVAMLALSRVWKIHRQLSPRTPAEAVLVSLAREAAALWSNSVVVISDSRMLLAMRLVAFGRANAGSPAGSPSREVNAEPVIFRPVSSS